MAQTRPSLQQLAEQGGDLYDACMAYLQKTGKTFHPNLTLPELVDTVFYERMLELARFPSFTSFAKHDSVLPIGVTFREDESDLPVFDEDNSAAITDFSTDLPVGIPSTATKLEKKQPEAPPPYDISQLKGDQPEAYAKIVEWLETPNEPIFVLRGYAGVGKTHLQAAIMAYAKSKKLPLILTAPTNQAAKQLALKSGHDAQTTQSALSLRMVAEGDELVLRRSHDPQPLPHRCLFVIDEGSMLPSDVLEWAQVDRTPQMKILMIGDQMQLPPVGEVASPIWNLKAPTFLMEKVLRFDNALLNLSLDIRKAYKNKKPFLIEESSVDDEGKGYQVLPSLKDFKKLVLHPLPTDYLMNPVVCWRHARNKSYTDHIRSNFGFTAPFHIGEPVFNKDSVIRGGSVAIPTNTTFVIDSIESSEYIDDETGDCMHYWLISSKDLGNQYIKVPKKTTVFKMLMDAKANKAKNLIRDGRPRGAWADFWLFKQEFNTIMHAYARTVHSVQGSTFTSVYLDQRDILANKVYKERMSAFYVAATRATDNIYTYV